MFPTLRALRGLCGFNSNNAIPLQLFVSSVQSTDKRLRGKGKVGGVSFSLAVRRSCVVALVVVWCGAVRCRGDADSQFEDPSPLLLLILVSPVRRGGGRGTGDLRRQRWRLCGGG